MRFAGKSVVVIFLGLIAGGIPSLARERGFSLFVHGGGAGHEENNLKAGLAAGFGISVPVSPRLSLTAELDYWETRSRFSHRKLANGRLVLAPILIGVRLEFRPNAFFVPYVVAGGGYIHSKFRIGPLPAIPESTVDQQVQSGWAGQLGAGAGLALSERWNFFFECDYLLRTAPGRTVALDGNRGTTFDEIWINLHVVLLKFGLRFSFETE